jgi:hypothetical protein
VQRTDANSIALRAVRSVLDAALDFEADIGGKHVAVVATRQPAAAWPRPLRGLDEEADGPWPSPVEVRAEWSGGSTRLVASCSAWNPGYKQGDFVGLMVAIADSARELVWITVPTVILGREDGDLAYREGRANRRLL